MRSERSFVAERALASHCAELLRKGPAPEQLLPLLGRTGERLARRLSGALAPMLGGEAPPVSASSPREGSLSSLNSSIARLAANSLFVCGQSASPLLVSIEAEPVLRMVDRAFGGKGEAPSPLPDTFPMAAELMIARIETLFASHLSAAISAIAGDTQNDSRVSAAPAITVARRDGSLAMLEPFAEGVPLAILTLEVDDGGVLPWMVTLAMPMATLARLFGFPDPSPGANAGAPVHHREALATNAPFGDVPLAVSAVLVDMSLPFAAVANLCVGQVLPVAVARAVPLRVGGHTIAHGTVGTVDDRVAIQITNAF